MNLDHFMQYQTESVKRASMPPVAKHNLNQTKNQTAKEGRSVNLENTVKYFAKSTLISDSPRATASDSLTGTDIMAAMGMTWERAAMGYSAFWARWA